MRKDFLTQGFMVMIYAVLGIVLLSALFTPIMSALATLVATSGASTFIAFTTVCAIVPTILLLALSIGSGIMYYKGYKQAATSQDPSGLLRMVFGILQIVLFITMFATVITNYYSLYTTYGTCTTWIAFGVVITIVPTILFLAGVFSGGLVAVGGGKTFFGRGKKSSGTSSEA